MRNKCFLIVLFKGFTIHPFPWFVHASKAHVYLLIF